MNLILLGPPGAGKGTQARLLCEQYNLLHISTGEMLREEVHRNTPTGRAVKEIVDAGRFVSDEIVFQILEDRLLETKGQGILLDGIPRTVVQAEKIAELFRKLGLTLDAVIQLSVEDEELIKRLASRIMCKACGASYSGQVSVCTACGSHEFEKRADDVPETIKKRLTIYNEYTSPLINYYKDKGLLKSVDGIKSVQDVFIQIQQKLSLQ